jgi:hypothetical protein
MFRSGYFGILKMVVSGFWKSIQVLLEGKKKWVLMGTLSRGVTSRRLPNKTVA